MRIFSNFDTQLDDELYQKEIAKFGQEKVMIIHRDPIYIWLKIFFPWILSLIVISIMMYVEMRLIYAWSISPIITNTGIIMIIICILVSIGFCYHYSSPDRELSAERCV